IVRISETADEKHRQSDQYDPEQELTHFALHRCRRERLRPKQDTGTATRDKLMKGHYCSDIATKTRASDRSRIINPSSGLISLRRRFSLFGMRAKSIGLFFWVYCARRQTAVKSRSCVPRGD